jgi:Ca2+:H+ antiporter
MSLPVTVNDTTPLLHNGNGHATAHRGSFLARFLKPQAHGEPSWLSSFKFFFFGSWLNILLVAAPLSAVAHYSNWDAALRFGFSFVAIMPLAAVRLLPPLSPST